MGTFVTTVVEIGEATTNGETISNSVSLYPGADYVSAGVVVAAPSGSGNVPTTPSQTARVTWLGPSSINSTVSNPTITSVRAVVVDVAAGEKVWLTLTEYRP